MDFKNVKNLPSVSDERGEIVDILEGESIGAVTLVTIRRGAVRGNHIHKETVQWNYILSGCVKYVSQENTDDPVSVELGPHDFAKCAAGESHAFQGIAELSEMLVFTRGPRGGKEYESDTYRLANLLIPAS